MKIIIENYGSSFIAALLAIFLISNFGMVKNQLSNVMNTAHLLSEEDDRSAYDGIKNEGIPYIEFTDFRAVINEKLECKSLFSITKNEHNLKNVDLEIPKNSLVVMTGVSGSGKSSLAFDTIYAEGQRRYVESLSAYARQFLGGSEKPDVDSIEGLSPAISIDQKTTSNNPRSTVGTVTEIYDYIRLLYARVGEPHCPHCGKKIEKQSIDQIVDNVMKLEEGTRIQVLAPVVRSRKGEHTKLFEDLQKEGFARVRVDGEIYELSDEIKLDKNKKHEIELIVDRLVVKDAIKNRLTDSVETALKYANKLVLIDVPGQEEFLFSQNYACVDCGISLDDPRMNYCWICFGLMVLSIILCFVWIVNENKKVGTM